MPPVLQQQVHAEVVKAKERSGWPAKRTLQALGIARGTYYRWLREEAWARAEASRPVKPVQPYEALAQEKEAVKRYALDHPTVRHRELAWRMLAEIDGRQRSGSELSNSLLLAAICGTLPA